MMQLVSTLTSDSPLSPPLLEERLRERGKKKLVVTVTLCNDHIKVQRMNHGKLVRTIMIKIIFPFMMC